MEGNDERILVALSAARKVPSEPTTWSDILVGKDISGLS